MIDVCLVNALGFATLLLCSVYFIIYLFFSPSPSLQFIHHEHSPLGQQASKRILQRVGPYRPPWWYSPYLGTMIPFGYDPPVEYQREIFSSHEAEFALDWYPMKPENSLNGVKMKIVLFLPGLGLSSKNKFCKQFVKRMGESGYFTAVVTTRGIDVPLKSARFWHPGLYDDALMSLEHIRDCFVNAKIFLVGFSAGTNIVQKVLLHEANRSKLKQNLTEPDVLGQAVAHVCEDNSTSVCSDSSRRYCSRVAGAMCVCVNKEYLSSRTRLEQSFLGCIFSFLMTLQYKDILQRNSHVHHQLDSTILRNAFSAVLLSEYDKHAARLHNFPGEQEYFEALSTNDLSDISTPLLVLQPADDPLHQGVVRLNLDVDRYRSNKNLIYVEPSHGNHFGFYDGPLWQIFSNKTSYMYPAKVAEQFFELLDERELPSQ